MSDLRGFIFGVLAGVLAASGPAPELAVLAVSASVFGVIGHLVVELGEHLLDHPPKAEGVVRHWTLSGGFFGLILVLAGVF